MAYEINNTCGEVSLILHYIPEMADQFARTLTSVFNQSCLPLEILVLCQADQPVPEFECCSIPMEIILEAGNLSRTLNRVMETAKGKYLLFIDNSVAEVILKHSLLDVSF